MNILLLAAAVITGIVVRKFLNFSKHTTLQSNTTPTSIPIYTSPKTDPLEPDMPVSFGYKCVWIAVKGVDTKEIARITGIRDLQPVNWSNGIARAYDDAVFICPPVDGWTLMAGWDLPHGDTPDSIREISGILQSLSRSFGEAQFFGTHRVVGFVCWIKAVNGEIRRIYSYTGERGENIVVEGEPTEIESSLHLVNTLSEEAQDPAYPGEEGLTYPCEEEVMTIAGAWSIDPTTLKSRSDLHPSLGLSGKMPDRLFHK